MASTSLKSPNERSVELNEVGWWSNWDQVKWLSSDAYVMFSDRFPEYFFNRGGFVAIAEGMEKSIERMEQEFAARRLIPYIFVQKTGKESEITRLLAEKNYKVEDQMLVMELDDNCFRANPDVKVEIVQEDQLEEWARTYLTAFYS